MHSITTPQAPTIPPVAQARSNHEVICALAKRVGAQHPGFGMSARELIDWTLQHSGWGTLAELEAKRWIDCQPDHVPLSGPSRRHQRQRKRYIRAQRD